MANIHSNQPGDIDNAIAVKGYTSGGRVRKALSRLPLVTFWFLGSPLLAIMNGVLPQHGEAPLVQWPREV